jgi:hypothetical protein
MLETLATVHASLGADHLSHRCTATELFYTHTNFDFRSII